MRINQPVTQQEAEFASDATLMSTTDAKGDITYANDAFVAASGFDRDELTGAPHNIVRHPDMPTEAFADMWSTLKAGEPWSALVKNRTKRGDHYWVRANAVPIHRDGQTVGYMSVRTKPGRDEVQAAQGIYDQFKQKASHGMRFQKGIVVRGGIRGLLDLGKTLGVRARIRLNLLLLWALSMIPGAMVEDHLRDFLMLAMGTSILFALAAVMLEAQIATPLEDLKKAAIDVATGESRNIGTTDRIDEIAMTRRAISQVGLMFRWLVKDVGEQAQSVRLATDEIAQGNHDLANRTEQAASSVQLTAQSMRDMTQAVHASNEAADRATQLAVQAKESASSGGASMDQVISTMKDISESSSKIHEIIGVIDGIAFQTNILALNAAVEAARAGDQGRGFAVVAGEVRTLAQRSAAAAKEIKTLIGTSVDRVEAGSALVDKTGAVMQEIQSQVEKTANHIAEIRHIAAQQSQGIHQVNVSVGSLDDIAQQNAALVEEGAAAASSLHAQASNLAQAVGVFS